MKRKKHIKKQRDDDGLVDKAVRNGKLSEMIKGSDDMSVLELHDEAMDGAWSAEIANRGAYLLEKSAWERFVSISADNDGKDREPTFSILGLSVASLALRSNNPKEAIRIAKIVQTEGQHNTRTATILRQVIELADLMIAQKNVLDMLPEDGIIRVSK